MARILMADDEPTLLQLLRRYLERQGHTVVACESPSAALAAVQADPQAFDVVVSDLSFPDMDGETLIAKMRVVNPKLRAIIASGYPHQPKLANVGFLLKPFLPQMLADEIAARLKP